MKAGVVCNSSAVKSKREVINSVGYLVPSAIIFIRGSICGCASRLLLFNQRAEIGDCTTVVVSGTIKSIGRCIYEAASNENISNYVDFKST